jgi:NaMN:DMB phosphoribosyltransferase
LLALGISAEGRISGSMPGNAHHLKTRVARDALRAAGLTPGDGRVDPLDAASEVGDPMQPLAAGIASGALVAGCDVLLAGGCQMLAVAALMQAIGTANAGTGRLAVGTTRWVAHDPHADVPGLARDIDPHLPLLAANLNFATAPDRSLRDYERFIVKEGVGAGGAAIAAVLASGTSLADLHTAIYTAYTEVARSGEAGASLSVKS